MSNFVRPFGLLGPRYSVDAKGLRYQRLAWLVAFVGIALGAGVIATAGDHALFGIAIMAVTLFPVLRLLSLVVRHGKPIQ